MKLETIDIDRFVDEFWEDTIPGEQEKGIEVTEDDSKYVEKFTQYLSRKGIYLCTIEED